MKNKTMPIAVLCTALIAVILWGMIQKTLPEAETDDRHTNRHTNRLAQSFSPYLRQHAHNPVDWYPWGEEALEKARREDRPILVSVGYSTCYWCHVLERETFMQDDVAEIMNEHFVNIKVDREIRPDIDEIYMLATQMITGRGGWPNNLLLTPDLKPFYAATYLPKEQWMNMLHNASEAWKNRRDQIEAQSNRTENSLKHYLAGAPPVQASLSVPNLTRDAYNVKAASYDNRHGGFGAGTKFPQETGLLFLLSHKEGPEALSMVQNTADHMLAGGIHDHIGGGFHRYATEAKWRIPHFEKMLYNQGLMAVVLTRLFEKTGEARYRHALNRLLDYVMREMTDRGGAFYSAQDAETDAVEGAYYVWNHEELKNILGREDYDELTSLYATEPLPHFPGHKHPDGEVLYRAGAGPDETAQNKLDNIFDKLLSVREKRKPPLRDEKILTAWNGMMIYGFAEAGRVLDERLYVKTAEKAASFILNHMKQKNGKLYRIYMDRQPHQNAFLEDYAWLARGLMALYRVTGKEKYKTETLALVQTADRYFADKDFGGYFMTDGSDGLFVRIKTGDDSGALPAGNPVMAHVFADLYAATGEQEWQDRTAEMLSAFAEGIMHQPYNYSHMIHAMMRMHGAEQAQQELPKVMPAEKELPSIESKDKVDVRTHLVRQESTPAHKIVKVIIDIEDGWHLNANPASLDFLIPTAVTVQTDAPSTLDVTYPDGIKMETPLGTVGIYEGTIEIVASVNAEQSIDMSKMRILLEVQACQDATCYPPSQLALLLSDEE